MYQKKGYDGKDRLYGVKRYPGLIVEYIATYDGIDIAKVKVVQQGASNWKRGEEIDIYHNNLRKRAEKL